jgi:hypothetical protein
MQAFKFPLGQSVGLALMTALSMGFWAASLADMVHFANGNNVRGKLDRMTGDIIEFRRSTKHLFGNLDYCKRIQLTDRHDVVETRSGQKFFGEIIYVDGFMLEIQTASGAVRINRLTISNVVLGSPLQPPKGPAMNQVSPQQGALPPEPPTTLGMDEPTVRMNSTTTYNRSTQAALSQQATLPSPGEDDDAIPAVDSGSMK